MDAVSRAKITDDLQDNIIDMMTYCQFRMIFKEKSLSEFWCEVSKDYPSLGLYLDQHTCVKELFLPRH
jgi:hypothetical protein